MELDDHAMSASDEQHTGALRSPINGDGLEAPVSFFESAEDGPEPAKSQEKKDPDKAAEPEVPKEDAPEHAEAPAICEDALSPGANGCTLPAGAVVPVPGAPQLTTAQALNLHALRTVNISGNKFQPEAGSACSRRYPMLAPHRSRWGCVSGGRFGKREDHVMVDGEIDGKC